MHLYEHEVIAYLKSLKGSAVTIEAIEAHLNLESADA